jgi:hypothetical protein
LQSQPSSSTTSQQQQQRSHHARLANPNSERQAAEDGPCAQREIKLAVVGGTYAHSSRATIDTAAGSHKPAALAAAVAAAATPEIDEVHPLPMEVLSAAKSCMCCYGAVVT